MQMQLKDFDSPNLFKELSLVSPEAREAMLSGIQWIHVRRIDVVLIGGFAVANYLNLSRPLTPDIDFLVSDLEVVADKLEEGGIKFNTISLHPDDRPLGITVEDFNMDFVDTNSWYTEMQVYAMQTAIVTAVAGIPVKVISLEMLTLLKLCLGREKDDNDANLLLKSPSISKLKLQELIRRFKDRTEGQGFQAYAEMINDNK